ncbi:HEAT repeat domain-containing protein [Streptomyces sp. NPDC051921]|uniref:HEAT repeat domain-containing protein n=1 Tax=Streptomyces sp. NPDC051921 TaxID=3155806 RepID=UPI003437C815
MRGFFTRRRKSAEAAAAQSAAGASAEGDITLISHVQGNVTVVSGTPPMRTDAADAASACETYAARVRQCYGRLDLEVLTPLREQGEHPVVPLREVFVPQSVRADPPPVELPPELLRRLADPAESEPNELPPGVDRETVDRVRRAYQERPPRPVLEVLADAHHDHLVLLGNPGAGKSTLARYLALALTAPEPPPGLEPLRGRLPLIIELRSYAQAAWRERSFEDFLGHQYATEGLGLPPQLLTAALTGEGPRTALVIFDGLDELFEKDIRDAVTRRIAGFAARHPRARVLVTSRGYGYRRAVLDGAGFANFMLQDLDREQIGTFTEQWFSVACPEEPGRARKLIARVASAVDGSPSVRELAGNPLVLTILAIIGRRRELPRDRRAVYEHAVDVLVEHWDPSKYLRDHRVEEHLPYLAAEDKRELLRLIARRMQEGHGGIAGNHIAGPDLIKHFEDYLRDRYALPPDRAATAARIMLDQFRHRNFILSRFGGEVYGFVHRAFLEYLTATDLAHRFNHQRELSEADLQYLFAAKVHDPAWQEVLLLLVGLLDERFVAGVLDRLLAPGAIAVPVTGEGDAAFAVPLFVARCLAEVRRPGMLATQSATLVRRVIRCVEVAEALDVTFFYPYSRLEGLGPALAALGDDWAGRTEYLHWQEKRLHRWSAAGNGVEPLNSTTRLTTDILLHIEGGEGSHLRSGSPRLRIVALEVLRRRTTHGPDWFEVIRHHVREDPSPRVRSSLLRSLAYTTGLDPEAQTALAVDRLLHDDARDVRLAALECIAQHGAGAPVARAAAARATRETDYEIRGEAFGTLIALAGNEPGDVLGEALRDEAAGIRAAALSAAATHAGDAPTARALVADRVRNDRAPGVVAAAIAAVGSLGSDDPGMHALLHERCAHPSSEVRSAALRCLGDTEPSDEGLSALLLHHVREDEDSGVRATALEQFVKHAAEAEAKRLCVERATSGEETAHTRLRALDALDTLDPARARGLALDLAVNADDDIRAELMTYLLLDRYAEDPEAVGVVIDRAAADEAAEVRALSLSMLTSRCGELAEVRTLAQDRYDNDPDQEVRETAFRFLADVRRDDPEVVPFLRHAAVNDSAEIASRAASLLAVLTPEGRPDPT